MPFLLKASPDGSVRHVGNVSNNPVNKVEIEKVQKVELFRCLVVQNQEPETRTPNLGTQHPVPRNEVKIEIEVSAFAVDFVTATADKG